MTNSKILLHNESLKNFIKKVDINPKRKIFLTSKIPQMDLEERVKLFKTLTEIYLFDLEEKEALEKIDKYWQK